MADNGVDARQPQGPRHRRPPRPHRRTPRRVTAWRQRSPQRRDTARSPRTRSPGTLLISRRRPPGGSSGQAPPLQARGRRGRPGPRGALGPAARSGRPAGRRARRGRAVDDAVERGFGYLPTGAGVSRTYLHAAERGATVADRFADHLVRRARTVAAPRPSTAAHPWTVRTHGAAHCPGAAADPHPGPACRRTARPRPARAAARHALRPADASTKQRGVPPKRLTVIDQLRPVRSTRPRRRGHDRTPWTGPT
jgi:hypothetical protein